MRLPPKGPPIHRNSPIKAPQVIAIFGALAAGGGYLPMDANAPSSRGRRFGLFPLPGPPKYPK